MIYQKVTNVYGVKQIGQWVTPYEPNKGQNTIILITILVKVYYKTHLYTEIKSTWLFKMKGFSSSQTSTLFKLKNFFGYFKNFQRHKIRVNMTCSQNQRDTGVFVNYNREKT